MTIEKLMKTLPLQVLTGQEQLQKEIKGCYIGDLLSWAMGKVQKDSVWLTVMGNVNAIAVAVLAEASCIVLVDGAVLDDQAKAKAEEQNVVVLATKESAYTLAKVIGEMLG